MNEAAKRFKVYCKEHGLQLAERLVGCGFVYWANKHDSGRVSWAVSDGELRLGPSWGLPSDETKIQVAVAVALYAQARGYHLTILDPAGEPAPVVGPVK